MPKLLIENGVDRGKSFVLEAKETCIAGRDKTAQVFLHDEMASRRHFQIEQRDNGYHLRDLGSSNGTLLNGSLLKKPEELAPNDRIQVGQTIITFQDETPHPLIGREISGYKILDRVGRGGMGTVYRALQTSLDRIVALKVLAPHLVQNTNFVNLFIKEARAAGALSHPNVVQVYDVGVHEDVYFFSMEYIPDGSVEDLLNRSGRISVGRALRIIHDAARGLQYAEQVGIVHRDIKPGNLMVGSGGVVKIGDLGISRSIEGGGQASQKDGVSGSPHYIAPEQARGHDIDSRVDIYSLGVSFYQMLSGSTPFRGTTPREVILKHLKEEPDSLIERVPELPTEVVTLVEQMMAKKPEERVASATALLEALRPLMESFAREGDERPTRRISPLRLAGLAAGLLVLAGVGFAGVSFYLEQKRQQRALDDARSQASQALDRAESALATREVETARRELESIDRTVLDEEQSTRIAELEVRESEITAILAREAREAAASASFEELILGLDEERAASKSGRWTEQVELLREQADRLDAWISAHGDTEAASSAQAAAQERRELAGGVEDFELKARRELEAILPRAEGATRSGEFKRAREALLEFPAADFEGSEASRSWRETMDDLERREAAALARLESDVETMISEADFSEARLEIEAFARRAGSEKTPDRLEALRRRVTETRDAAESSDNLTGEALLLETVRDAWQKWAESLESDEASDILGNFVVKSSLPAALAEELEAERTFLQNWRTAFKALQKRSRSKPGFLLRLVAEPEPLEVELTGIASDLDRVRFRREGRRSQRPWRDLTSLGRAEVIGAYAQSAEELLFAGLLFAVAGNRPEAERLWTRAVDLDSQIETRRRALSQMVERITSEAGPGF